MNVCPYFVLFCLIWIKFSTGDIHKNLLRDCVSNENQHNEWRTLIGGNKWIGVHNYHIYCPVWLKYGIRDAHLKLLWMCVFGQCSESCNSLMTKMKWRVHVFCETVQYFDSKECLCKVCALCHRLHHLEPHCEILYLAVDLSKHSTVICSHTLVVGTTRICTVCVSMCMCACHT
jgi:hypothetical protein